MRAPFIRNGKLYLYSDLDGDGIKEKIGTFAVDANGQVIGLVYNAAWSGKDWESLMLGEMVTPVKGSDGQWTEKVESLQSEYFGTFPSSGALDMPVEDVVANEKAMVGVTTLGSDGSVSANNVNVSQVVTSSGTSMRYSFKLPDGKSTTYNYAGTGGGAATAADVRESSVISAAWSAAILAELQKQTAKMPATVTTGTAMTWAGPDSGYDFDESQGDDLKDKGAELKDGLNDILGAVKNGVGPVPGVDDSGYGQTLSWTITLPVLGTHEVNLTPWENIISAFRAFLKFVLAVIAWIVTVKIFRGTFV